MSEAVPIEFGMIRKLFEDVQYASVEKEEVIHVKVAGEHIVSVYTKDKHAAFSEDYRDPMNHGPNLQPLMDYFRNNGYNTNLK